jgi:hypothetical protein
MDFRRLAVKLEESLREAIKKGQEPDMDKILDRLGYDYNKAAADFHRRTGRIPMTPLPPSGEWPK